MPRACDRCYSIKARCTYTVGQDACDRCFRLCHRCVTDRQRGKAGRPRTRTLSSGAASQYGSKKSQSPTVSDQDPVLASPVEVMEAFQDLEPSEVVLAQYLVSDNRLDRRFVNSFAIQSFFSNTMESTLVRQLLAAPGQVKDALLALAGALKAEEETDTALGSAATVKNMEWCCNALQKLRLSDSATEDDAKTILFVADCLVSVNDLTVGYGFLPIAQAALLAIKPWYPQLISYDSAQVDPHLVPVIFAEVMECGRCSEIPTFRWVQPSTQLIERSYGIAQEALPYLYDICVLTHDIKHSKLSPATVSERARLIGDAVQNWVPRIEPHMAEAQGLYLTDDQKSQMVRHATCYKLLAQLLLAQLKAQTEDNRFTRVQLAQQIRDEVSTFFTLAAHQVVYLLWPFFVACTELQDPDERVLVLNQMKYLSGGIATQSCNCMYKFLQFVWDTAAIDPTITWLELVESGSEFSIGP